jgi:hypothetical protein
MTCGNCPHFDLTGNHYGDCQFGSNRWIVSDDGCKWGWPEVHQQDGCGGSDTFEPIGAAAWRAKN